MAREGPGQTVSGGTAFDETAAGRLRRMRESTSCPHPAGSRNERQQRCRCRARGAVSPQQRRVRFIARSRPAWALADESFRHECRRDPGDRIGDGERVDRCRRVTTASPRKEVSGDGPRSLPPLLRSGTVDCQCRIVGGTQKPSGCAAFWWLLSRDARHCPRSRSGRRWRHGGELRIRCSPTSSTGGTP